MSQAESASDLRALALENLKRRDSFRGHLITYLAFQMWVIILWGLAGGGFFWPASRSSDGACGSSSTAGLSWRPRIPQKLVSSRRSIGSRDRRDDSTRSGA